MDKIYNTSDSSCWRGRRAGEILLQNWWECKLDQPLKIQYCHSPENWKSIFFNTQLYYSWAYNQSTFHSTTRTLTHLCSLWLYSKLGMEDTRRMHSPLSQQSRVPMGSHIQTELASKRPVLLCTRSSAYMP